MTDVMQPVHDTITALVTLGVAAIVFYVLISADRKRQ